MRADFAAADLQAAWDCPMLSGPVAAILAMQAPYDSCSITGPTPLQLKSRKISHPFGRISGNKPARRMDAIVPHLDDTLVHASPSCHPNAAPAQSDFSTDDACNLPIRPGWVPGAPQGEQPDNLSKECLTLLPTDLSRGHPFPGPTVANQPPL